ncbi:hypothetical protein [Achromobacter sp. DMS1]|uniref:hypothetical protein n=1 Tax=Achromobacter sp. DMS1 TaxID=1688405 RepID=UPI000A67BEB3
MLIVISEFMDEPAVQALRERFEVRYDPGLAESRAPCSRRRARPTRSSSATAAA